MALLPGLVWAVVVLLGAVVAYAGVCLLLLFVVTVPDDPPYHVVEDVVFAVTLPFVLAVLLASGGRPSQAR